MDQAIRRKQSFLLRLPTSLREQAVNVAQNEGTSLNHFISIAVAEKISRMEHPQQHDAQKVRGSASETRLSFIGHARLPGQTTSH